MRDCKVIYFLNSLQSLLETQRLGMYAHVFVDNYSSEVKFERKILQVHYIQKRMIAKSERGFLTYFKFITMCSTQALFISSNTTK